MSWNIEVIGASKSETLAAFNEAVDKDSHCEPKEGVKDEGKDEKEKWHVHVKDAARTLTEHMGEECVLKACTYGHTNDNGEQCNAAVFINC